MVECNFIEAPNIYPNLNDQQFRLNEISEIRNYGIVKIRKRVLMSKMFSKYIASFGYFGKSLIVLSATGSSICIASFASVIEATVGITSASFSLAFSISTGIVKKLLETTRNKKKKHNKTVMLARSKLNSIEIKIFKASINNKISHEDFTTIINEEKTIVN